MEKSRTFANMNSLWVVKYLIYSAVCHVASGAMDADELLVLYTGINRIRIC